MGRLARRNRWYTVPALAVIVGLVVAACGGGGDPTAAPAPPERQTVVVTATPTTAPPPTAVPEPGSVTTELRFIRYIANQPNFSDPVKRGGEAKIITNSFTSDFDITRRKSFTIPQGVGNVYNRLVRCAFGAERVVRDGVSCEIHTDLANSWTVSSDGKTWIFNLNQGIKWQNVAPVNGRAFTAADVVYAIGEYKNSPAFESDYNIVDTVTATDDNTVEFRLKSPMYNFLELLADWGYIVPREIKEADGDFKSTAVGTGPYITKSFIPNQTLVQERNPDYFVEGRPYIDKLEIVYSRDVALQTAAFRAGNVLWAASATSPINNTQLGTLLRSRPDAVAFEGAQEGGVFQLALRLDVLPYSDVRVRQAFASAINFAEIAATIYEGNATMQPAIPWIFGYDAPPPVEEWGPFYVYNPERARRLLDEVGIDRLDFPVTLYAYGPDLPIVLQAAQQTLKDVGIDMTISTPGYSAYLAELQAGDFPAGSTSFVQTAPGVDGYTFATMRSDAARNIWNIKDANVDRIVDEIRLTADPAGRRALVRELIVYEGQQLFRIPYPRPKAVLVHDPELRNFSFTHRGAWPHFGAAEWEVMWLDR